MLEASDLLGAARRHDRCLWKYRLGFRASTSTNSDHEVHQEASSRTAYQVRWFLVVNQAQIKRRSGQGLPFGDVVGGALMPQRRPLTDKDRNGVTHEPQCSELIQDVDIRMPKFLTQKG
jgi:hypothetical protein